MTGVRVIDTAVIGVILFGGLFGLFLRGLLSAGTFLALFLRVAGVSIAGAGGLLAGIALIFGVVLVLALDMVLVVLSGAGQGLYSLGLPRTLDIGDGRLLAFSVGTLGALIFVFAFGLVENLILGLVSALGLVENLILGLVSALSGVVNYVLGGG